MAKRGLKGRKRGEADRCKRRRFGSDTDDSDEEYEAWKDEDAVDDTDDDDEVLELDASEDCTDIDVDEEESNDSSGCDGYEEDEDFLVVEKLKKKKKIRRRRKEKTCLGRRKKEDVNFEVSEFDMEEENESYLVRGKRRGKPQVREKSKVSDSEYEQEEEEEEDDDDEEYDDDFSPDDEVEEDEEDEKVVLRSRKKPAPQRTVLKTTRRKHKCKSSKLKKKKSCKKPGRKRKTRVKSDIDDDDDDFLVDENCSEVYGNRKRRKVKLDEDDLDDDFLVEGNILHVAASRTSRWKMGNCIVDEEEDDNDFFVEDSILGVNNQRKSRRRVECSMEDEENDDAFVLQDNTLLVDRNRATNKGKRSNRFRTAVPMVFADSDPSKFGNALPKDNESRNLIVVDDFRNIDQEFVSVERNTRDKGKEKEKGKEIIDLNKNICGICLSDERKGVYRGFLDSCAHYFCFTCIMTWSKVESRCPMCKQRFTTISKSLGPKVGFGMRASVIKIPERDQVYQPSEEELIGYLNPYENIVCTECLHGGDDNLMLLCDLCDSPSHTYCVGLGRHVPEGNWYCDACRCADEQESHLIVQNSSMEQVLQCDDILHQQFSERNEAGEFYGRASSLGTPRQSGSLYRSQTQDPHLGSCTGHSLVDDGNGAGSHPSDSIGSTLSRRRSIHQRIRIILSGNRLRTLPVRPTVDIPTLSGSLAIDLNSSPR